MKATILLFILLGVTTAASAQSGRIALVNANLIDGESDSPRSGTTILIREGRIERVGDQGGNVPSDYTVIDLAGRWVMPGLIDAHTHIGDLDGARAALRSGVTTARNMGISHFVDIGMRELNRRGKIDLPELLSAGYHIYPTPREGFFLDFPQLADMMPYIRGEENIRRATRIQLERGVDVIKVNATDRAGTVTTDPRRQLYTEEEMRIIVEEARRFGRGVAAHAHGEEGGHAAVRAGVRSIEHGTYLNRSTLEMMKTRGTWLVPTLATMAEMIEPRNDVSLQIRGKHMVPRLHETTRMAIGLGVRIAAGTDTDYGSASNFRLGNEILELIRLGMPAMDAIRAASSWSAECLGISERTGKVKPGLEADLIVIELNPLKSPESTLDPLMVINNGQIALRRF